MVTAPNSNVVQFPVDPGEALRRIGQSARLLEAVCDLVQGVAVDWGRECEPGSEMEMAWRQIQNLGNAVRVFARDVKTITEGVQ